MLDDLRALWEAKLLEKGLLETEQPAAAAAPFNAAGLQLRPPVQGMMPAAAAHAAMFMGGIHHHAGPG